MVEIAGGGVKILKRFYRNATVAADEGGFGVLLDGRLARTPRRAPLTLPNLALAQAVAAEWAGCGDTIALDDLRLTRLAATSIDLGAEQSSAWRSEVLRYAGSDLICYRANAPEALARRQADAWDPFVAWARDRLGAALSITTGVVAIEQQSAALRAVARTMEALDPWRLICVKAVTESTGSAILALGLETRAFAPEAVFAASRIDETYQAELWGGDAEAQARAERLRKDFDAAVRFLALLPLQ